MMNEWPECAHRKHLTEQIMLSLIAIFLITIAILSLLKVRRTKLTKKLFDEMKIKQEQK